MDHTWKKRGILTGCLAVLCALVLAIVLLSSGRSGSGSPDAPSQPGTEDSAGTSQESVPQEPGIVVIQNTWVCR